jgi:hypothetical protein
MITQEWRQRKSDIWIFAIFLAAYAFFPISAVQESTPLFFIILLVGVGPLCHLLNSIAERNHVYMVVSLHKEVVLEAIENLLRKEGLIHVRKDGGFDLFDGQRQIHIGTFFTGARLMLSKGTRTYISLGPIQELHEPLVESLQLKIVEALSSSGLRY